MFNFKRTINTITNSDGGAGATVESLSDLLYHNKFSRFFPWHVYDPETSVYHNTDGSQGAIWECSPLCFASEKTLKTAEALMRLPLPRYAVLQFLIHADPNIKPVIRGYKHYRHSENPLIKEACTRYTDFLNKCTGGLKRTGGIPLRQYRLFVSLSVPVDSKVKWDEITMSVSEILKGMNLWPRLVAPADLLEWTRRFMNGYVPEKILPDGEELAATYCETIPIGKQILYGETDTEISFDHIRMGKKNWVCLTPKTFPGNVDPLQTSELFGGVWGLSSDGSQINVPYMYALNIIFDDLKGHLRTKCDLVLQQGAIGSFARSLQRKQEEYTWAVDKIDQGEIFARAMPICWFYHEDIEMVREARTRSKYVWESAGYTMQEDKGVLGAMFFAALPLGFRSTANNINMLDRDIIAPADSIINILPVQADFSGSNEPIFLFQGRKGQIVPMSIFSKRADNYNGFIAASSGKGKSFLMNFMAFSHFSTGVKLRIVDLGGSYAKLCNMFNGRYMDFDKTAAGEAAICMNPFTNIVDLEEDVPAISAIIMQMIYASIDEPHPTKEEYTLAKDAVLWTIKNCGEDASVDDVFDYFNTYPEKAEKNSTPEIVSAARHMAFSMHEFTSRGQYGRYFIGRSTFNIRNDDFVVLELDALRGKKDLFKVVTLLVLDAAQRDLYLSDRAHPRQVIFDEAWQFLDGGNKMMMDIIEGGYRRARKYHGSFFIITQSLLDRKKFGAIGDIIWNNAEFKFLLQSDDFERALSEKLIDYDPFIMELLKSVKTNAPHYSEIFCDTPFGNGVVRLAADDFSYYIYTSHPKENAEMDELVKSGLSWNDAILEMVRRYRSG